MTTTKAIDIGGRRVGPNQEVFVIAEMSANHHQDFDRARRIVDAAADAGADAIKLQTYRPDTITIDCDRAPFRIDGDTLWSGQTLYELYESAFTPWTWHRDLREQARRRGLLFFSSPFDPTAVEFLDQLDVPAYKVASFEIVDLPLLEAIAARGKPVILSTGMAELADIDRAVQTIRDAGNDQIALLKCTSAYPAPVDEANVRTISHLARAFGVPAGISDHTLGEAVPVAAVALGACIVEKHLTLSRGESGPDSAFSLEPGEFEQMVDAVRTARRAIGDVCYGVTEKQRASQEFRRSLFAVRDIEQDEMLTESNVRSIRPADGLPPRFLPDVLDRRARRAIPRGTPLAWNLIR